MSIAIDGAASGTAAGLPLPRVVRLLSRLLRKGAGLCALGCAVGRSLVYAIR